MQEEEAAATLTHKSPQNVDSKNIDRNCRKRKPKKRGRRVVGGKKGREMERKEVGDKTKTKYVKVFMIRVDSWLEGRNLLDDKLQCVRN